VLISYLRSRFTEPSDLELHPSLTYFGSLGIPEAPSREVDETLRRYTPRLPKDEVVRVWLTQIIPRWRTTREQQRCLLDLGIPSLVRGRVWICAIGNEQSLNKEHYFKCLQHRTLHDSVQKSRCVDSRSDGRGEIQLDVSRTRCVLFFVLSQYAEFSSYFCYLCRFGKLMPDPDVMQRVLNAWWLFFSAHLHILLHFQVES
jgi:hypothetical protein